MKKHIHKLLKVEFLYKEVIEPIQLLRLLDPNEREVIELMHLIISRCYYDLDELSSTVIHKKKYERENLDPFVKQSKEKIKKMYSQLHRLYNWFNDHIVKEEDKIVNKIKDFFTSSQSVSER